MVDELETSHPHRGIRQDRGQALGQERRPDLNQTLH
jgi:hypothetical protein